MAKMLKRNVLSTPHYLLYREYTESETAGIHLMKSRLNNASGLFRKDLYSHYGCVNAIEFSNEGDYLVSGGDDRRVLLWNVSRALNGDCFPVTLAGEHASNIFCLAFDNHRTHVFSAGNDDQVIVHDCATGATADVFLHEEAVYALSVDPVNDSVFASAGEDGQILVWDIRAPSSSDPLCLATGHSAFHGVMYNPVDPQIVATANSKEGLALWDTRYPKRRCLLRYQSSSKSESYMSVRFNNKGTQILALRRRLPPVIYNIRSPIPACYFDHREYYNSCTMKSCCFAGDSDEFVMSGSDDFNLYMWKIPDEGSQVTMVEEPHMILKGHRSIVNQVRYNYSNFIVASSGVEKVVKLWTPFEMPNSTGGLDKDCSSKDIEREVYSHEEYLNLVMRNGQVMSHDYSHKSTMEDPRMMAFFDSLVQREIDGWNSDTSLSSANADGCWPLFEIGNTPTSGVSSASSSDDELGVGSHRISPLTIAYASALANRASVDMNVNEPNTQTEQLQNVTRDAPKGIRISQLIAQKRERMECNSRSNGHLNSKRKLYLQGKHTSSKRAVQQWLRICPISDSSSDDETNSSAESKSTKCSKSSFSRSVSENATKCSKVKYLGTIIDSDSEINEENDCVEEEIKTKRPRNNPSNELGLHCTNNIGDPSTSTAVCNNNIISYSDSDDNGMEQTETNIKFRATGKEASSIDCRVRSSFNGIEVSQRLPVDFITTNNNCEPDGEKNNAPEFPSENLIQFKPNKSVLRGQRNYRKRNCDSDETAE